MADDQFIAGCEKVIQRSAARELWEALEKQHMPVTTDYGVTSTAGEAGIVAEIFDRLGLGLK